LRQLRQLQSLHNSRTPGTTDTIVSDSCEINPIQLYPESPVSTIGSVFYQNSDNLDIVRVVNCDLAMNNLTTINTPEEI